MQSSLLLIGVLPASAGKIQIKGAGAATCADWTQAEQRARAVDDPRVVKTYDVQVQWVLGFLVGFSHFKEKDLLQKTDYSAVSEYVGKACKLKPLALIFDVAVELGEDLAK